MSKVDAHQRDANEITGFFTAVDIDGECESDADCTAITGNSLCVNGVCACDAEEKTITINGKKYCYKSLAEEECSWDDDCLSKL